MTNSELQNGLRLRGARLVLPSGISETDLIIEGSRIVAFESTRDDLHSIELDGATVFPGFVDIHIHGADGVDTNAANKADLHHLARFLMTQGVTSFLPTLVPETDEGYRRTAETIDQLIAEQHDRCVEARVVGLHYEGPFVNTARCGALHTRHFKVFSNEAQIKALPSLNAVGSRMMMTLAPEIEGGLELIAALHRRGWIASIGHTNATVAELDQAYVAGARHMTHFMNAMAPLHHRNPGPIGWGLSRDDVTCDIIADGIHLDRSILRLLLKVKGSRSVSLISDAIAAAGKGDGDYKIWGESIVVKNGRTSNAAGSIAGSVITMLDAVLMMRSLGVSDLEIAQMASMNPSRLLRIDKECGSIEEGKRADLVAIDGSGAVQLTMVGGEVVFRAS
jgi:N-acetylglucosamine-6-phosphate deacetylase